MVIAITAALDNGTADGANLAERILAGVDKTDTETPDLRPDLRDTNFGLQLRTKKDDELEQPAAPRKQTKKTKSKQTISLDFFCGASAYEDTAR